MWFKGRVPQLGFGKLVYALAVLLNIGTSVGIGFGFVMLLIFHIHLLSTGFSTYTYLIEQRRLNRPAAAARAPRAAKPASDRQALVNGEVELPGKGEGMV